MMDYLVTRGFILTMLVQLTYTTMIPQHSHCQKEIPITNTNNYTTCDTKVTFRMGLNTPNAYCSSTGICLDMELEGEYQITGLSLQGYKDFSFGTDNNIHLLYDKKGSLEYYLHTGTNPTLRVQGKKGDEIEYHTLKPFSTSKIKIQFPAVSRKICLRMTLHGCQQPINVYDKCPTREPIIEKYNSEMKFTHTKADIEDITYGAKYLVLTRPYAWCLSKTDPKAIDYADWATIDLSSNYIIYGLLVKGYKYVGDKTSSDKFIAKSIRFQYSLDGKSKSDVDNTPAWTTVGNSINFDVPVIAKYVYVSMLLDRGGQLTCIKIEVYGCRANKKGAVSTTTGTTSSSARPTRDQGTSDANPIDTYEMYDGSKYLNMNEWIDRKYNGKKVGDGRLVDGTGCIVVKPILNGDPFTTPCWIGWHRNITQNPFISLKLRRISKVSGLRMRVYVNKTMKALPFQNMRVRVSNSTNLTNLGNLCAPNNYHNKTVIDYYIRLDTNSIQIIRLDFNYSSDWFFLRYIEILKTLQSNNSFSLSNPNTECVGKKLPSVQTNDEGDDWRIPVIVIVVLILLVLVVFFVYRHRESSWEDVRATLRRQKPNKDDEEECKELAV